MRLPCWWPNDEHVVVPADTLNVGTGCTFDKTAVHDLPPRFLHFAGRERTALRHVEARSSATDFRHGTVRDPGIFIPHSRKSSTVSIELLRYTAISVDGGSTTIVTQAARPACIPPHNSRLRASPRPTNIDGQASKPSQTRCSKVLRRLADV
jgi:hypothetical protein